MEINLSGWVLVHVYRESHGDHTTYIYQQITENSGWRRRVTLLDHTVFHRCDRPDNVAVDNTEFAHDYLLAKQVRQGLFGEIVMKEERNVSPCCTSGSEIVETSMGYRYRMASVAGHGEWATRIDD